MNRLAATLVLAAAASALAAGDPAMIGKQAKEFKCTDSFGMRPMPLKNPLHSLKGRVVLFTMFESWYDQCTDAVPDMNALYDKYGPRGMTVLACGAQERAVVEKFIADQGVRFPWVLIDTPTQEQFKRDWNAPGMPWAYLIDANGKIVWQENPRNIPNPNVLKPGVLDALLPAAWQPPYLPKAFAAEQKLLDDRTWAQAKKALLDAAAGGQLAKPDAAWAKGVAAWIDERHDAYLADADALCKKGFWWDAWDMMDEFPRIFEGMDGADKAKAKAEEIRKNPDAAKDLAEGDDVRKAKELVAKKNWTPARLVLARILRETKGTRHAERAQDLTDLVPPK